MSETKRAVFSKEMKDTHTILIPTMLPIHFRLLSTVMAVYGYKTKVLSNSGKRVIEQGLKNVHNDTCYPAQLVIGQLLDALETDKTLDLDKIALMITQTGGGCRASNYLYLLRKALDKCGYENIPVVSATFMKTEQSPGFSLPLTMILQLYYGIMFGDLIMLLNNQCLPYELEKGATQKAVDEAVALAEELLSKHKLLTWNMVSALMKQIIDCFKKVERSKEKKIKVGIVGEIYVKYSPLGNNNLEDFLLSEGCEVVCPGLMDFMLYSFANSEFDYELYGMGGALKAKIMHEVNAFLRKKKRQMIELITESSNFEPPAPFEVTIASAEGYIGHGVKMGEGWLLTAEMVELIQHSHCNNIVCTQPFGCLPNHICGKGVMRTIKEKNPQANIVAVDYDSGSSAVNQQNRIKLMLANARMEQKRQQEAQENEAVHA